MRSAASALAAAARLASTSPCEIAQGADQISRTIKCGGCGGELDLGLVHCRFGAGNFALRRTEFEIVENCEPLTRDHPISDGHVQRLDAAACWRLDAGKVQ